VSIPTDFMPDIPVVDLPTDEWELSPDLVVLQEPLGSGNFGEVYKAFVTRSSRLIVSAVKILKGTCIHMYKHACT